MLLSPVRLFTLFVLCCALSFTTQLKAQDKPEVMVVMSSHASKPKGDLLKSLANDKPFDFTILSIKDKTDEEIEALWQQADLVMLDGINPALSKFMFEKYTPLVAKFPKVKVISLGDLTNKDMNQGLNDNLKQTLGEYYQNGGSSNYRNMMAYLANDVFALSKTAAKPPINVPEIGLYHYDFPTLVTDNEAEFFNFLSPKSSQTVIGVAIHRSVVDYEQQQIVDSLIKGLEQKGAKAFGVFFEGEDKALNYTDLLTAEDSQSRIDLLINYRSLHYVQKRRDEFERLGVPVIHALNYNDGSQEEFEQDNTGVSPALTPFFLVMPEDTGSTDPTIIASTVDGVKNVIDYQLDALIERAINHAKLKHLANSDKKVATFIWNYPPGEKNIGAAFLDVPSSIENIANAMKEQGYQVTPKTHEWLIEKAGLLLRPYYRQEDTQGLIDQDLADYLPLETYLNWFNGLPNSVTEPIIERWGKPEDSKMLRSTALNGEQINAFVIPRMNLGNMIVMPQGVRGEDAKEHNNLYHDTKTPINHSYLAIYLYARNVFNANAFIHLGTHGSQEWLTGKERGLSVYDAPSLAVGNIPVFYPYIIDNVGEAMQAKRRGRATLISHLTPGFAKAGLYAEIAELSEKIDNYVMLSEGQTQQNTQKEIIRLAVKLNILTDLNISEDEITATFDTHLSKIQDHLNTLAQISQPLGVHIFGQLPKEAHLYSTMIQMLGDDFAAKASHYEEKHGLTLPETQQQDNLNVTELAALPGYQLLNRFITQPESLPAMDDELSAHLTTAKNYWDNFHQIAEIDSLLNGLDGQYIPVGYGGDPIRNPQAVPTGRNLIGFNPAKVPSKEAYDAGVELMEQTIAQYQAKHGRYPQKLAFSLWSLETMRHQGALEAQILHALGVKPTWDQQGNISGTEIIPYSELKRPRIDVVISATGLYRDAFPNVMLWIAKAIDDIAKLKEDNNFVYRHSATLKQQLLDAGNKEEDADYLSSIRIFSNETGNYGTGLASSALASDTWETDEKLANLYLNRMGYAYGHDESKWSLNTAKVLGENNSLYRSVLSGTEGVVFSRSTNLYAMMTNDDPFQYFGGIGLAVRNIDGKTPEMYVSNLRNKDKLTTQTLDEFISQEMRSRYFHPRWIKAMQDAGYAGATAILDRMNNMWGWEVMTPEAIRDDQWQEFYDVYIDDKYQLEMREFFENSNPESLAQIIERMLEAERKGYWKTDEATIKKLVKTYTELASEYDIATDNTKFNEYMDATAQGFGLMPLSQALANMQAAQAAAKAVNPQTEQVTGQKLEQQANAEIKPTDYRFAYVMLLIFAAGFISNKTRFRAY